MSSIFISHSSKDNKGADFLRQKLLEAEHYGIFLDFDPADGIPAGRNWEQELYAQLRGCQAVIVLCSPYSMKSPWCFAEITHAKALGKAIFPIKIADCEIVGLLSDVQITDSTGLGETETYTRLWRGLKEAGLDPRDAFDWDNRRPPYPGLLAFEAEDAAIYCGRKDDIDKGRELLNQLRTFRGTRLILVLGASGSGKSSLVKAGILPRLKKNLRNWLILDPFRPKNDPFAELANVIEQGFKHCGEAEAGKTYRDKLLEQTEIDARVENLLATLDRLSAVSQQQEATILITVDQFEELLGDSTKNNSSEFLTFLQTLLTHPTTSVMVLATIRSDFFGTFQTHPILKDSTFETLPVNPLRHEAIAQVIQGPADVAGLELETGLVELLVNETNSGNALPLLAFTLRELWEGYGEDKKLEIAEYRQLGGLRGSVAKAAQTILDGYCPKGNPKRQTVEEELRCAFLRLLRLDEDGKAARRLARWQDLPVSVHSLLERFVRGRLLMSRGDNKQNRLLEVSHETIFTAWPLLRQRIEESRVQLRKKQKIEADAQGWQADGKPKYVLLEGRRLRETEDFVAQYGEVLPLNDLGKEFLDASLKQRKERRKQWARVGGVVAGMGLIAIGFWGWREFTPMGQRWEIRRDLGSWSEKVNDWYQSQAAIAFGKVGGFEQMNHLLGKIQNIDLKQHTLSSLAQAAGHIEDSQNAVALLETVHQSTQSIKDEDDRRYVLIAVAEAAGQIEDSQNAVALLETVHQSTQSIKDEDDRRYVLIAVAEAAGQIEDSQNAVAILNTVHQSTQSIKDEDDREDVLSAVAEAAGQIEDSQNAVALLETVHQSTQSIKDEDDRRYVLIAVAEAAGQIEDSQNAVDLLNTVHQSAQSIKDEDGREDVLSAVAEAAGQIEDSQNAVALLNTVHQSAQSIKDEDYRIHVLIAVTEAAGQIEDSQNAVDLLETVDQSAQSIKEEYYRGNVLIALAKAAGQIEDSQNAVALLKKVHKSAQSMDNVYRGNVLIAVAEAAGQIEDSQNAVDLLNTVHQSAQSMDENYRDDVLIAVAEAAGQIEDSQNAVTLLKTVHQSAQSMDENYRDDVLIAVAEAAGQIEDSQNAVTLLKTVHQSAQSIEHEFNRDDVLIAVTEAAGQIEDSQNAVDLLETVHQSAQSIKEEYYRRNILIAVAEAAGQIEDSQNAVDLLETVHQSAQSIKDEDVREDVLSAVAEAAGQIKDSQNAVALLKTVHQSAQSIEDEDDREDVLSAVAEAAGQIEDSQNAVDLLNTVHQSAQSIEDEDYRDDVLIAVAEAAGQIEDSQNAVALLNTVHQSAQSMDNVNRKNVLIAVAEAAGQIEDNQNAVSVLKLVYRNAKSDSSDAKDDIVKSLASAQANLKRWGAAHDAARLCTGTCRVESLSAVLTVYAEQENPGLKEKEEGEEE